MNNNNRPLSSASFSSSSFTSFTSQLSSPPLSLSPLSLLSLCAQWTSSPTTDSPQRECPRHWPPQMKCPVHQHYRRERGRERGEVVERSGGDADGGRITDAVVEMMICNEINKLHCKMYRHSGDADGGENVVNKSKFVVECADGDNHAKFAFGGECLYYECDRQSASNFIVPLHPSLYSEVCSNASLSLPLFLSETNHFLDGLFAGGDVGNGVSEGEGV